MLVREADLELSALPYAHQREGMLAELLACGCGLCSRLRSLEHGASEQILEALDARRDRRLSDVELVGRLDEAARLRYHEEGACEIDIHGPLVSA